MKAQVESIGENEDKVKEDVTTRNFPNDFFVAHFKDRVAGIKSKITFIQRTQQDKGGRIRACETELCESEKSRLSFSSDNTTKVKRVENLNQQLENMKKMEKALLMERELIQKLPSKQIQ